MPETINNEQKGVVEDNCTSQNNFESEMKTLTKEDISGGYHFSKVTK